MESLRDVLSLTEFPAPVLRVDRNNCITDYSNKAGELLVYGNEGLSGLKLSDIFPDSAGYGDKDYTHHHLKSPGLSSREVYRHPRLEDHWVEVKSYPCEDGHLVFVEDVSGELRVQGLVRQAQETARLGSWEVDLENGEVYWSEVTRQIHEVPDDYEPTLQGGIDFYKPGFSREAIERSVAETMATGKPFDLELIIRTHTGKEKWIRAIGHADLVNGSCKRFYGLFQDIDEVVKERDQYKILNNRYEMATIGGHIGIWDFNMRTQELIWSDTMFELYDIDRADFNGKFEDWANTIHPEDREKVSRQVWEAAEKATPLNIRFRIVDRGGAVRYLQGLAKVYKDNQGNPEHMIGINLDYTRQMKSDERLQNLLNMMEEQNKSLVDYSHIVSHNLRSNSSNLTMLSHMLKQATNEEDRERYTCMIETSIDRLNETILHLNEVIQIQFNEDKEFQSVNLLETFHHCVGSLNGLISEHQPELLILIPARIEVKGVRSYVESVFINLITNSMKYRREGVPLTIRVHTETDESQVVVKFSDNGRGIDMEKYRDKVFGMYKTFHGNKDARGIGLFLTKNHMNSMEGSISLESRPNQGTEFTLKFKRWGA